MTVKHHWRVYADIGRATLREFGTDYPTLDAARAAKARYSRHFPIVRYSIKRHRGPALAWAGAVR